METPLESEGSPRVYLLAKHTGNWKWACKGYHDRQEDEPAQLPYVQPQGNPVRSDGAYESTSD